MGEENKGFTIPELVIAVAISILIAGSVAVFLYAGSSHYRRTKEEISLQMEAQLILSQMNELILEAENVKFDAASDTLRIKHCDLMYIITLNRADQTLLFEKVTDGGSETGKQSLFGRYVEELQVEDTGIGDRKQQIRIFLQLQYKDQSYTVPDYIILLRNQVRALDSE